jgi:uncharacterized protein involved in exopolysaccharide biosynthesis
MTIFKLIGVLYSRRFLLIGIFIAIVGAGMTVTLLLAPTYQSTMKILITRDRVDPQVTPAEKNPDYSRGGLSDEDFNSEIEILQSRAVLKGVARQISLDKQYAEASRNWFARFRSRLSNFYHSFHGQAAPDAMEIAVTQIGDNLEAVSVKKSRVIKVTYSDSNPERAAQILDELYRQYAEHHFRLLQNSKAANVFHEQTDAFNRKLKEATEALKRFDERTGVKASAAQQELLLRQFHETRNHLDNTRTEIRETEKRIAELKAQIKTQPERIESEARTKYVAALDKIKEEILTLELQRTQLLQKYQPNHRLVKEVEERLAQAREAQAREEKSPPHERSTVLNEVHRRLTSELLLAQANLATLRERERALAKLTQQYKEQVSKFDAKSLERNDLERARAVNEEAYLLYRKKAQEADIVNALNQERIVNFSLAEPPGVNRKPVSPRPLVNLLALTLIGLMAAIAVVAFIERDKLSLSGASLPAASHAGSLPLAEGANALSPRRTPLLLSENPPERNGHHAEPAPALAEWTTPASILNKAMDKAMNGAATPGVASSVASDEEQLRQITKALPKESDFAAAQYLAHSSQNGAQNGLADHKPEAWRVAAVVDYLRVAYHLPPEKMSEFLRETVGWEISSEEIDEILSRADTRRDGE